MTTGTTDRVAGWFTAGEQTLLRAVAELDDVTAPSLLPGWTRAHVLAHLVGNARALGNLVTWARTGTPTPMYADPQARAAQIESDATRAAAWLLEQVAASSRALVEAYRGLTEEQLAVQVRTAQGRTRQAREVAWMRTRESVVHLVDLDAGARLAQAPADVVRALLDDAVATVATRPGAPDVDLVADDGGRWRLAGAGPRHEVHGPAAELCAWVIGRPHRLPVDDLPALPAWL